jgi:hypothetical protein
VSSDVHYFSPTTPGAASFDEDVSDFVRLGRIGPLSGEAQMAAVGSGSVTLDDVASTVGHDADGILGLKQWYWNETACPVGNRRLYTGYTFDRRYQRGDSLVTGAARQIDVTLMDPNAFLSFRVFAPEDVDPTSSFNRPAEDAIDRIAALLDVDFLSTTLFDLGYIPTTGGKPLDAHDYTGFKPFDVVNDIAQVMGWNPWVGYDETENKLYLWFDDWKTDGSATVPYDSTLRLTNVEAEEDATTLLVEKWPVETVDPSRVISAVWVIGKNGQARYRTRPTTAYTFGWRDAVMQAQFLSDPAKLDDLGDRYLLDNSTEDHKITVSVKVSAALVTAIHEGMRIEAHFTHCPSVNADFGWCRILHRTVRRDQETPDFYWMDLELSPIPAVPCAEFTAEWDLPLTPSGLYHPLGGIPPVYPNSPDIVFYKTGSSPTYPISPDHSSDIWPFPTYDIAGGPAGYHDTAWGNVNAIAEIYLVGPGTLTAHSVVTIGSPGQYELQLMHGDEATSSFIDAENFGPFDAGDDTELVVPDDGHCAHVVRMNLLGTSNVEYTGFAGYTWEGTHA